MTFGISVVRFLINARLSTGSPEVVLIAARTQFHALPAGEILALARKGVLQLPRYMYPSWISASLIQ